MTMKEIKNNISADSYSSKDGIFTVRKGFFYRLGKSAEQLKEHVLIAFPKANIIDVGEHFVPFHGGASISNSSHFYVRFRK